MKKMNEQNLEPNEKENLVKIINHYITSQTSAALSKLLYEPIKYNVLILEKEFFNLKTINLAPDEIKMCAVRLNGTGDTHIEICYAIKMQYAQMIASKLLGQEVTNEIDEMGTSAIQEVANIMTGSFFNAMSNETGFRVELSTPDYLQGDIESLVRSSAKNVMHLTESAVITDAELIGEKSGIRIHMLIMQNINNARKLLVNHIEKSKSSEFSTIANSKSELSGLKEISVTSYAIGAENSELDALVDDLIEKNKE